MAHPNDYDTYRIRVNVANGRKYHIHVVFIPVTAFFYLSLNAFTKNFFLGYYVSYQWRKDYAHQRETTGTSINSLQSRPFTYRNSLKGKNLLPEGANSILQEQFLMVCKIVLPL